MAEAQLGIYGIPPHLLAGRRTTSKRSPLWEKPLHDKLSIFRSYDVLWADSCWIALLASLILAACFYANKIGQTSAASAWLQHFTVKPGSFHHSHAVFIAKWRDLAGIAFGCGRQPGWGEKDGKGGYGIRGFNQLAKLQPEMISIRIIQTSVCVCNIGIWWYMW